MTLFSNNLQGNPAKRKCLLELALRYGTYLNKAYVSIALPEEVGIPRLGNSGTKHRAQTRHLLNPVLVKHYCRHDREFKKQPSVQRCAILSK